VKVLELPHYGFATYLFEMEEPMTDSQQIERLIAVLSVPGLSRTMLLGDHPLKLQHEMTDADAKVLRGYGWTPDMGLASFLNFRKTEAVHHDKKPKV
jgi:hypothetical protein